MRADIPQGPGETRGPTRRRNERSGRAFTWAIVVSLGIPVACAQDRSVEHIRVPAGFTIERYAGNVPNARTLVFGDQGTLFVGTRKAGLGVVFYTGTQFPASYRGQIFLAEHGSWNRSRKVGYRVSLVRIEGGKVVGYEPFAQGWLKNERAWGRPAYLRVAPDGSLLVSDDRAGAIYRIRHRP